MRMFIVLPGFATTQLILQHVSNLLFSSTPANYQEHYIIQYLCDFQGHKQGCDMGFVFAFHHEFGYEFHLAFQIPDFGPMSLGMTSILHSKFLIFGP